MATTLNTTDIPDFAEPSSPSRGATPASPNPKMKAVYTIIEGEHLDKSLFRRIGNAFVNRDGSLNVFLDAFPVSGKLHIRDLEFANNKRPESPQGNSPQQN